MAEAGYSEMMELITERIGTLPPDQKAMMRQFVDTTDGSLQTPLAIATYASYYRSSAALLTIGADPTYQVKSDRNPMDTPIEIAARIGDLAVFRLLADHMVEHHKHPQEGATPLVLPNSYRNAANQSLLHQAARGGRIEVARQLLAYNNGYTAPIEQPVNAI